jgi:hypothetical protein
MRKARTTSFADYFWHSSNVAYRGEMTFVIDLNQSREPQPPSACDGRNGQL